MSIIPRSKFGKCFQCSNEGYCVKYKKYLLCIRCNDRRKLDVQIKKSEMRDEARKIGSKLRSLDEKGQSEILKSRNNIINDLDFITSRIVRLMATDENGMCTCYICKHKGRWEDFDNGHFVKRNHLSVRFDITYNCRACCKTCNQFKDGNMDKYAEELKKEIGKDMFEQLLERGSEVWKPSNSELSEMLIGYKHRLKILKSKIIQ